MKREGYVYLNDVPTRVVTWGKWIEDSFTEDDSKELILCIPGNPGVTRFYENFLQTVYDKVKTPIWIVGHSGHEWPKDLDRCSAFNPQKNRHKFCIKAQIDHKIAFINRYVPNDVKIYLLGHSVGTYCTLYLLERPSIKRQIIKNYFLFPTIEHIGDSVNGQFMTSLIRPIVPIILFFSWIFTTLPYFIQRICIYLYCKITNAELHQLNAIIDFVDPYVLGNVFTMAYDQIDMVKERPNDMLKKNLNTLKLYYGDPDNWVPKSVPGNVMKDIPDLDVEICQKNVGHSFVLWQSVQMGEIVADWLTNRNC